MTLALPHSKDVSVAGLDACRTPIRKILLATNLSSASKAAFQAALRLCTVLECGLRIHHVIHSVANLPQQRSEQALALNRHFQDAEPERSLDALVLEARRAGLGCEGSLGRGITQTSILEMQKAEDIDLLILGMGSFRGFEGPKFGPTAEAVLSSAPCPVLMIGSQAALYALNPQPAGGIVLFATDFHVTTAKALCRAASMASMLHLPLHCLHVLPRGIENGMDKGRVSTIIVEGLQHLAAELCSGFPPPVCAVTFGSEVSNALVQYAKEHGARLIVLGVRRASLTASHLPAHIAYRVIAEAPCAVMTVGYPTATYECPKQA